MKTELIILAAGSASRMGQAKQLLPMGETHLLGHAIETALSTGLGRVSVVLGAREAEIAPTLPLLDVRLLSNPKWEEGMGSSIQVGVRATSSHTEAVLIMLGDQPLLTKAHLLDLHDAFQAGKASIIASEYSDRRGVPALFGRKWFATLAGQSGQAGARKLIRQQAEEVYAIPFPGGEQDIDTPEDWKRFLGEGGE